MSKRLPVKSMSSPVNSPKRPRHDDEGSSSKTKTPEELKAISWKLCEPAPVSIDRNGSITATGNTVYVNPAKSSTLYEFNAVKREWVNAIQCDRESFGLAVVNGDLTLVGGKSHAGSNLKTLTSLISGTQWSQVYPPMNTCEGRVAVCGNGEHLLVSTQDGHGSMEVMDVTTKKWRDIKNTPSVCDVMCMTLLGDRVCVLGNECCSPCNDLASYCVISTCSLSALLESPQFSVVQPLVWHKVCPISDLYSPSVVNLSGNIVAIGGKKNIRAQHGEKCSFSPVLHVYNIDSKDWDFVCNLPERNRYPHAGFLVATLQGDRLIVCGGRNMYCVSGCSGGGDDDDDDDDGDGDDVTFVISKTTDIVCMGHFK